MHRPDPSPLTPPTPLRVEYEDLFYSFSFQSTLGPGLFRLSGTKYGFIIIAYVRVVGLCSPALSLFYQLLQRLPITVY